MTYGLSIYKLKDSMTLIQRLFFTLWYIRKPPWDTHQSPPELLDFIKTTPPGRALDLGCGTGTNVITLAQNGWLAVGIDFIPKAIRVARQNAQKSGVHAYFHVGDATKLSFLQASFDLILDMGCYQSLGKIGMKAYRQNILKLLSPRGTYLLYLFFRSSGKGNKTGATEADLEPFLDDLELIHRQDGYERGVLPSAWLTYKKPRDVIKA